MSDRWLRARAYFLKQFQQTSTWRGLVLIATALRITLEPAQAEAITAAGLLVSGLIAALFPDEVKK
jgi:hypothetical protein